MVDKIDLFSLFGAVHRYTSKTYIKAPPMREQ